MRRPPNQINATLEMLIVNVVTGSISACQRPAARAASERSWLARSKRLRSNPSRVNARITRMPESCSRRTLLTPSISLCMPRKTGSIRETMR